MNKVDIKKFFHHARYLGVKKLIVSDKMYNKICYELDIPIDEVNDLNLTINGIKITKESDEH